MLVDSWQSDYPTCANRLGRDRMPAAISAQKTPRTKGLRTEGLQAKRRSQLSLGRERERIMLMVAPIWWIFDDFCVFS